MKKASGIFIALVGVDGSGKTTIAGLIDRTCHEAGLITIRTHWRPYILPSPKFFFGQKPIDNPTSPHANAPHGFIVSQLLLLYYFVDFVLGFFFKISRARQRNIIIISERYFFDVIFDPSRHRLQGISWLAKILISFLPKPDLIIFLHGEPSVLHSRKSELSINNINLQQHFMRRFFRGSINVNEIDVTSSDPLEISRRIVSKLIDLMNLR